MFFFNDYKGALIGNSSTPPLGGGQAAFRQPLRYFLEALRGEDDRRVVMGLSALLVMLLHVWIMHWLKAPTEPIVEAKPLIMEVSMVAVPKPVSAPQPAPTPPVKPVIKKPVPPKKPKPKPQPVKKSPVAEKKPELPVAEPKAEAPSVPQPVAQTSSAASNASASAKPAVSAEPKYTEANFRANYGFNPKPEYPRLARSRGWQGKVLLKVQVSAKGDSLAVDVHQSSDHDVLDEAAVAAVKRWKFIPAKRGDVDVASSVIVPIFFKLDR